MNLNVSDAFVYRRHWFDNFLRQSGGGVILVPEWEWVIHYTCPCCGYPTLQARWHYEICILCSWEDDGQDDSTADEVWGGPNADYSLIEARNNFDQFLTMYNPPKVDPNDLRLRRKVIEAFNKMIDTPDQSMQDALWESVRNNARLIRRES